MCLSLDNTPRRHAGWLFAVMLVIPALARADDPKDKDKPKDDKPATPAEQYQTLLKEFGEAEQGFFKAYQEAKTDEERQKLVDMHPVYAFPPRFLEFAQKHATDPAAFDALSWIAMRARATDVKTAEVWSTAIDTILRDYIESEKLGSVLSSMVYSYSPKGEKLLRTALENSPHSDVQGQACFALAQFLKGSARLAEQLKGPEAENEQARFEQFLGKDYSKKLKEADPGKLAKEVEDLCEKVLEKYPDVKHWRGTLGEAAEGELFEIRNLAIGKVAPDIEGEDVDGEKFKISDYRGKVVVLDFWGNW